MGCRLFFRQADQDAGALAFVDRAGGGDPPAQRLDEALGDGEAEAGALPSPTIAAALRQADRKSTRLNSSHMSISYAVFCLKKKKKNKKLLFHKKKKKKKKKK